MKIEFGKYKGKNVDELSTKYLLWILATSNLDWKVRVAAAQALDNRHKTFVDALSES